MASGAQSHDVAQVASGHVQQHKQQQKQQHQLKRCAVRGHSPSSPTDLKPLQQLQQSGMHACMRRQGGAPPLLPICCWIHHRLLHRHTPGCKPHHQRLHAQLPLPPQLHHLLLCHHHLLRLRALVRELHGRHQRPCGRAPGTAPCRNSTTHDMAQSPTAPCHRVQPTSKCEGQQRGG